MDKPMDEGVVEARISPPLFPGQTVARLEPVWLPSSQIGIPAPPLGRPRVEGKFLFVGNQKYWVRGGNLWHLSTK
jgi:hypothetical protein